MSKSIIKINGGGKLSDKTNHKQKAEEKKSINYGVIAASLKSFFHSPQAKSKEISFLLAFLLLATAIFLLWSPHKSRADSVYFFPGACLGNWQNPELAQSFSEGEAMSRGNSALYDSGNKQIFCSGFKGEISADAVVRRVVLKLAWQKGANAGIQTINYSAENQMHEATPVAAGDNAGQEPVAAADAGTASATDNEGVSITSETVGGEQVTTAVADGSQSNEPTAGPAPADDNLLNNQSGSLGDNLASELIQNSADSSQPPVEQQPAAGSPPNQDSSNNPDQTTQNQTDVATVVAVDENTVSTSVEPAVTGSNQEINSADLGTSSDNSGSPSTFETVTAASSSDNGAAVLASSSESSTNALISSAANGQNVAEASSAEAAATAAYEAKRSQGLLDIKYSLDGVSWKSLVIVGPDDPLPAEIELPLDNLDDLDSVRLEIEALRGDYAGEPILLDGLKLAIDYEIYPDNFQPQANRIQEDFASTTLQSIKSYDGYAVVKYSRGTSTRLAYFDQSERYQSGYLLADDWLIKANSPLGFKGDFIFWISRNNRLYAFNLSDKKYLSRSYTQQEAESGVNFDYAPDWQVRFRDNVFYFFSSSTGEVFSDDNGDLAGDFYKTRLKDLPAERKDLIGLQLRREEEVPEIMAREQEAPVSSTSSGTPFIEQIIQAGSSTWITPENAPLIPATAVPDFIADQATSAPEISNPPNSSQSIESSSAPVVKPSLSPSSATIDIISQ